MLNKDSRTDNWAGHRDYNRSNYHSFPRSAREAGFNYISKSKQKKDLGNWVIVVFFIAMFIGLLIVENLHWVA